MKRVPIAAFRRRGTKTAFAASITVLMLATAAAQDAPPAGGPPASAPVSSPAGGAQGTTPATTGDAGTAPGKADPANLPKKYQAAPQPVATNPLLLGKPLGPDPIQVSPTTSFGDYRQAVSVGVPQPLKSNLPVFGYDFFQPARDLVEAHRAFLRRQYQNPTGQDNTGASAKPQPSDAAPGKPQPSQAANDKGNSGNAPNDKGNGVPLPGALSGAPSTVTLPDGTVVPVSSLPKDAHPSAFPLPNTTSAVVGSGAATGTTTAVTASGAATPTSGTATPSAPIAHPESVNAFDEVADPLSQLYRNVSASVPPSYQLSGGDAVNIRYWSPRHETRMLSSTVDVGGALTIDDVGMVVVRGLTLEQAEKTIRERLRRFYNGVEVSVTLAKLRTIQVTLTGAAFQPGTYTVPAVATAYNVLYAAGGPLEDGSLRAIEVRRNGKIVGTLDLYHFLLVGNHGEDIALQSGDLIYIPHRKSRVAVMGEVLQPAIFELRDHETLKDVLQYAGGVRPAAVAQRVRVNTVDPGAGRIQKDVDLSKAAGSGQALYDGDEVEVFSVRPLLVNTVSIEGAVDQPSTYALTPNMRISDLIERARGVISEAYIKRANLYRWNANNTTTLVTIDLEKALAHDPAADIALERWDRLAVFTRKEVAWTGQRTITVRGAVQRAGAYTLSDNMRISDLLLLAGGPTPDAYLDRAVLLHQHGDGSFGMDYVNLGGLPGRDPAKDMTLQDGDVLAVYRTGEAQFEPEHVATIHGEVVAPGPFPRTDGMHLSDLIKLAGGFKPGSSPTVNIAHARRAVGGPTAKVNVVQVRFDENHTCAKQDDVVIEDGDVVTVQGTGGFINTVQVIRVNGAVNHPGPIIMPGKTMRLSDAVTAAGGLRPEAFPSGAEFYRDPRLMATDSQRSLASIIGGLNDLLNESTYNREKGKSYVERIRSINAASQPDASPLGGQNSQSGQQGAGISAPLATALAQQEMVSPARKLSDDQLNANGNIAINLPEAMRRPQGAEDILLADGDTITIPETPTTIQVVGAVFHGRGVMYRQGEKLDYYVAQAGGFAPDAARDRIEVIHVGGGLIPAVKVGKLLPGDVILVPTRVLAEKLSSHQDGFSSFFKSLTSSAIIFRVATSLFGL